MTTIEGLTALLRLPYPIRARLQPALLTALPVALGVLVWFPRGFEGQAAVAGLLSWAGIAGLVMALARDRGKALERALWQSWGGASTTRLLRFRDAPNKTLLALQHQALRVIAPSVPLPQDAAAEAANRAIADSSYDACVSVLRSSTRKGFPLVYEENCSYGYRRNLLGLRSWGIASALIGLAATGVHMWWFSDVSRLHVIVLALTLAQAVFLLLAVKGDWVRSAADAYANRLLEAAVDIAARTPKPDQMAQKEA